MGFSSQKLYQLQLSDFQSFLSYFPLPLCILLGRAWVVGELFSFEGGNIASVNSVSIANVLNVERGVLYGIYHIIKSVL